jgi:hypothetical protein
MVTVQLLLVSIVALMALAFGIRYFFRTDFMPYHAVVAGKPWAELETGVQIIIRALYKIGAVVRMVLRSCGC